jgi:DnaK suppressor protein
MDDQRARELIDGERRRLNQLIRDTEGSDQTEEDERGDMDDDAERLTASGTGDAVISGFRDRLAALDRAEERLQAGTYGLSVRSGKPIPDARLEADPAAELTVEEAARTS